MTTEAKEAAEIKLPTPHASQKTIADDAHRFKVINCGRRWGKTFISVLLCVVGAMQGGRIWWVAPTYKQALEGWRYLEEWTAQMDSRMVQVHLAQLRMEFASGGEIQIRSGDDPDSLRGPGLDGVVLDEAAIMKPEVWTKALRPALSDKGGWAVFISTPKHYNWFYELYENAKNDDEWACWTFPTWDNPHIPPKEIESARRTMRPEDFNAEYGAEFTAVGGAIFPDLGNKRNIYLRPMPSDLKWVASGVGADWGTTEAHKATVVLVSKTDSGAVWIRKFWSSSSGSGRDWMDQMGFYRRNYDATFAAIDHTQTANFDTIKDDYGFYEVEVGIRSVEAGIGNIQSLVLNEKLFFDSSDPDVVELFTQMVAYHRDDEGKVVEVDDDGVDAVRYGVAKALSRVYTPLKQRPREMGRKIRRGMERTFRRSSASPKMPG